LAALVLSIIHYTNNKELQIILSTLLPFVPVVAVGIPVTKYLPSRLNQIVPSKRMVFQSLHEAFEAMPFGINKKLAKDIDTIIKFEFTGKEAGIKYMTIKGGECTVTEHIHANPETVIHSDSELWLNITAKIVSGIEAFINEAFTIDGDASKCLFLKICLPLRRKQMWPNINRRKLILRLKLLLPEKLKTLWYSTAGRVMSIIPKQPLWSVTS